MPVGLRRSHDIGTAVEIEDRGIGGDVSRATPPARNTTHRRRFVGDAGGGRSPLHKCVERGATARSEVGRGLKRDHRAHRQHRCPIEQMLRMRFCGGTR
jgi:hypothetical protein